MQGNPAVCLAGHVAFALHDKAPMLRFALVAVVVVTGCTRRQQDFAWFAVNVAAAVADASSAATAEHPSVAVRAPDPDDDPGPTQADLERARNVALELTALAAQDARNGNCDPVVRTSNHVRVIDPAVFANVFLRDPAIQHCLAIAPEPPIANR
jgi:hypothetical protein